MSEDSPGDFGMLLHLSDPGRVDRVVFGRKDLGDHLAVSHDSNSLYVPGFLAVWVYEYSMGNIEYLEILQLCRIQTVGQESFLRGSNHHHRQEHIGNHQRCGTGCGLFVPSLHFGSADLQGESHGTLHQAPNH